jgi:3-oxoacyl-(acyl-carrier-protein) synthase
LPFGEGQGFTLSGGVGGTIVGTPDFLRKHGIKINAEIRDIGMITDHGASISNATKESQAATMRKAMRMSENQNAPVKVRLVSAHKTGTKIGDTNEREALEEAFGGLENIPKVFNPKDFICHGLAAAAMQAHAIVIHAMETGQELPVIEFTTDGEKQSTFRIDGDVLLNAFGFGGANGSMVLRKWEGTESEKAIREHATTQLSKFFELGDNPN